MTKHSGAILAALFLLCSIPLAGQKKPQPTQKMSLTRAIRFQGAPQYTQEELLAAAGLKPDARLNLNDMKAHAKQLNDTGLFKEVKFSADNKALLFTLTPSTQLFPMHLDNVPLTPGRDLDAKLHERIPLYRDLLPASGSTIEGICQAFEEMLSAKGVKATVKAALTSGLGPKKLTAMNFSIVSPAVHIGRIQLAGISEGMLAKAHLMASGQTGNSFDTENSAAGLRLVFEGLYQDLGYAAVQVEVAQVDPPVVSDQSVDIPFAVTIKEGGIYKLGTIDFPASALVGRAEVEKIRSKYPAGSGHPLDLFFLAIRDAYHGKGYLDCSIVPHPSFVETTHIVNYSPEVVAGPQYHMASVKFDGAPDAMAAKLKVAWKMPAGSVFDESYVANFAALAQKKDKLLTRWMQSVVVTYDVVPDPATHQVNCILHFAKAVQNPV
jgi:outer membrane protein assembly factor BamA